MMNDKKIFEQVNLLLDQQAFAEAIALMEEVVVQNTADAEGYCWLGNAYFAADRLKHAIHAYAAAIRLKPQEAYYYQLRGAAYFESGRFQPALSDFNESIRLAPYAEMAYWGRGKVFLALDDAAWALAQFSRAVALDPTNPQFFEDRAQVLQKLGRMDEAREDLETAETLRNRPV